jgi:glucose-1-phosphate thymidylyltransferase
VVVENSEIERCIVLEHSVIRDLPARLQDSLIGRNAVLTRSPMKPKALKMNLGDYSQIGLL